MILRIRWSPTGRRYAINHSTRTERPGVEPADVEPADINALMRAYPGLSGGDSCVRRKNLTGREDEARSRRACKERVYIQL
jgi:hypothetical protein